MNHQEVIDFIEGLIDKDQRLMRWDEFKKWKEKKKEVVEYIRKLAGVH